MVSKRVLFGSVTALILFAVVEVTAYLGLGIVTGNWFAPATLQETRLDRVGGAGAYADVGYAPTLGWVRNAAIHPYVGYVEDPSISKWPITDFGYYESERPLYRRSPDKVILGIFGGSFAHQFREYAIHAVVAGLQRDPRFEGREIVVASTALGGYKQPQQLMTLNWLLALGGEFDIVLNIDGFNEVALHNVENRLKGVFPAYPRSWYFRAIGIGDGELVERAATLRRLQDDIAHAATFHSRLPWRWSAFSNLVWVLRDHNKQAQLVDAHERLLQYNASTERYVATGPDSDPSDDETVYTTLVDIWKQSSLQMARLCRANDITYVHALQPNQYLEGSKKLSDEERNRFYRRDHPYRPGVVSGYPRLREAGRELVALDVPFIDLTQLYAGVTEEIYKDDCCHVNEQGYLLVADPVVEAILSVTPGRRGRSGKAP